MGWDCVYMIPMMMGEDIRQGPRGILGNAFLNFSRF
jgi:hypothetical protein